MMKLKRMVKRITAFSLAVLMTVVAFPYDSVVHAGPDDYPPEIMFPVNILDFRADNLLFQYVTDYENGVVPENYDNDIQLDLYDGPEATAGKGLVENTLDPVTGLPVYKQATVEDIAGYVQKRLGLPVIDDFETAVLDRPIVDGKVNYISMRNYIRATEWTELQAETDAVLAGSAAAAANRVNNVGGPNDGTVTFEYNSPQAGTRTIRIYYAGNETRDFGVTVNAGTANQNFYVVNCPDNGSWENVGADPVTVDVEMIEGVNTISISGYEGTLFNAEDYGPNLGHIEVDNSYVFEEANVTNTVGAAVVDDEDARSGAYLQFNALGMATYTFDWKDTGTYYLELDYANGEGTFTCNVNGNYVGQANGQGSLEINLVKGTNTIQLINGAGQTSIDAIRIYSIGYPLGNYAESKAFFTEDMNANTDGVQNTRNWTNITTCMDYAYFMTSNLFKYDPSLNTQYNDYKQIVFHKIDEENGKTAYEFMADQNHANEQIVFNKTEKTIRNLKQILTDEDVVATMEAETGALAGGAAVAGNNVGNLGGDNNGSVTFTYNCEQAGHYAIRLYYASDAGRAFGVNVNGTTVTTSQVDNNSWTEPSVIPVAVSVDLVEGNNTIVVSGVGDAYAPNLDKIDICTLGAGYDVSGGGSLFIVDDADKGNLEDIDVNYNVAGKDHNFHYTVSSNSYFVYKKNAGQYFYFSGDDDVYVYVNGHLLVDLGGAHQQLDGAFNLDELADVDENNDGVNDYGLVNGEVVTLSFFYMERQTIASNFYAKLNFKLATDELSHVFEYQTIPYGHLADLTYSYTAMRELNTNSDFVFSDNFGNKVGASRDKDETTGETVENVYFQLADGVSLENNTLIVRVKNQDGSTKQEVPLYFTDPKNPTQTELDNLKACFLELQIECYESLEIEGLVYDTATEEYLDYEKTDDDNARLVTFEPEVTYKALMKGASEATTTTLTASNPVKVIVGSITIKTSDDADNLKKELADYGAFQLVRTYTDENNNRLSGEKICCTNDAAKTYNTNSVTIDQLVLGDYTLYVDPKVLTGYTVIIDGTAEVKTADNAGNVTTTNNTYTSEGSQNPNLLMIPFHPEYNSVTKEWYYPKVIFELKATRDLPGLNDLT